MKPAEYFDATVPLVISSGIEGLLPGEYRIESILYGWNYEGFTEQQRTELATIGTPFLRGEIPASIHVRLTP